MASEKIHVKLSGGRADAFKEVRSELGEWLGYEPSNAEVVGLLIGHYNGAQIP